VIAANNDGVWNTEGATLEIVVVPPFWRTWWFYILTAITLGLIVFIIYKFPISRLERANAAQAAFSQQLIASQENERKRIALTIFKILTKA
jgi:signal transduction histidine kinase